MYQILSSPLLFFPFRSSILLVNINWLPYCVPSVLPLFKPSLYLCSSLSVILLYMHMHGCSMAVHTLVSHSHPFAATHPLLTNTSTIANVYPPPPHPMHSLPMNLFMFEHFHWHLNSSHRFLYKRL